ncbi:uncharacterized protein BDZ83DRAFT_128666 [Colletotrichum acutatum]|uniref:Uncharacterized protein n=1 Tax=Glomerella acutata TaxID=27357 RepID=A0AAD8XJL8_GLOAC|nr:uncharacterized protein BDZ83DRAFT_128666 [Colletotrichum acutatum]KAK1728458.1 hypothetical protein BDZ83DRAFT_128666 [Colletotrichum acutatum]
MDRTNRRGKHIYRRHCPKATSTAGPDTDWGMLMTRHGREKKNRVVEDQKWGSPARTAERAEEVEKAGLKSKKRTRRSAQMDHKSKIIATKPKKSQNRQKSLAKTRIKVGHSIKHASCHSDTTIHSCFQFNVPCDAQYRCYLAWTCATASR